MKVAIIGGAGSLGSTSAFTIATNGLADEIVIIDPRRNLLIHHVGDIGTAVAGQDIKVRGGNYDDIRDAEIVLITAGAPQKPDITSRREMLSANLPIIQDIAVNLKNCCPEAVIITTTTPVEAMNYAIHLTSKIDRHRLLGFTMNDTMRFREMLGQVLGIKASRIQCAVIGEHGDSQVILFSSVMVDGKPLKIEENTMNVIRHKMVNYFPDHAALKTGLGSAWTSAVGIASIIRAVSKDRDEMIPVSVVLNNEYGYKDLSVTVPAILGTGGVKQILEWELTADEQERLESSASIITTAMHYVEQNLR